MVTVYNMPADIRTRVGTIDLHNGKFVLDPPDDPILTGMMEPMLGYYADRKEPIDPTKEPELFLSKLPWKYCGSVCWAEDENLDKSSKENLVRKKDIDKAIIEVCWRIIREPLLYFSEADVQQMLVEELHGIDSLANTYETQVPKGEGSKAMYKTSLVHREYGAGEGQRFDVVIFDPNDVRLIDHENLMINGDYLEPAYAFELGTEKTAKVGDHLDRDIKKLKARAEKMICGYLIYLYKDTAKTERGKHAHEETNKKIEDQFKNVVKNKANGLPKNIKMLAILIRTAKNQPRFLGKCEIFNGTMWEQKNVGKKNDIRDALQHSLGIL